MRLICQKKCIIKYKVTAEMSDAVSNSKMRHDELSLHNYIKEFFSFITECVKSRLSHDRYLQQPPIESDVETDVQILKAGFIL